MQLRKIMPVYALLQRIGIFGDWRGNTVEFLSRSILFCAVCSTNTNSQTQIGKKFNSVKVHFGGCLPSLFGV